MYHTIIIVGNLGRDPEMRYTPSGQAVTDFSVASNRQYTNSSGQKVKETIWFRVSAWGKNAEICSQYLHKSSLKYWSRVVSRQMPAQAVLGCGLARMALQQHPTRSAPVKYVSLAHEAKMKSHQPVRELQKKLTIFPSNTG